MDDDQFQGGLSVQGGNPDPNTAAAYDNTAEANTSYDTSAGDSTELPPLDFEESTPAPEAEPQHEIDPEMSRRMDEALGGFDTAPTPVAYETPVANPEPVQQPTDFASPVEEATPVVDAPTAPVEAPVPPVAAPVAPVEAPVEEPVQPAPEAAMPGYETPVAAPVEQAYAADPMAAPAAAPMGAAGSTIADFANVPQNNPAPMQPMATVPAKKGPNKVIIIALIAVLVLGGVVAAILLMNQGKSSSGGNKPASVSGDPDPEPPIEVQEYKSIGSEVQGYVDVPKEWLDATEGASVFYKSVDGKTSVRLESADITVVTAAAFANMQLAKAQNEGASQPQMTSGATKKVGTFNSYEVNYYTEATKTWNFKYIFEATDNRTHYIWIQSDEPGSDLINSILKSFKLTKVISTPTDTDDTSDNETEGETEDETEGENEGEVGSGEVE
ncbi:hypothetical protein IKX12_01300 [Candidatus Saccharibacteria bacterium]|nr:hypothetical protein [Candidatus Saccharibacteria bacterium]